VKRDTCGCGCGGGSAQVKNYKADTMSTVELAAHRDANGIVLLPVGCTEMHGLHLGVGCDTFEAEAASLVLAEAWGAVVLPTVAYSYAGATTPWAGTISILPVEAINNLVAVIEGILRNGFKRIVLVSIHGPNNYLVPLALRTVFERTGEIPVFIEPDYDSFYKRVGERWPGCEPGVPAYLAVVEICGRHGEYDPAPQPGDVSRTYPMESLRRLVKHKVLTPYLFTRPEDHVGSGPGLTMADGPEVAKVFREVLMEQAKGFPEDYAAFQADMKALMNRAPWKA